MNASIMVQSIRLIEYPKLKLPFSIELNCKKI